MFLCRVRGGKRGRERETSTRDCTCQHCPDQESHTGPGMNSQLRYAPWSGMNLHPSGYGMMLQSSHMGQESWKVLSKSSWASSAFHDKECPLPQTLTWKNSPQPHPYHPPFPITSYFLHSMYHQLELFCSLMYLTVCNLLPPWACQLVKGRDRECSSMSVAPKAQLRSWNGVSEQIQFSTEVSMATPLSLSWCSIKRQKISWACSWRICVYFLKAGFSLALKWVSYQATWNPFWKMVGYVCTSKLKNIYINVIAKMIS